MLVSKRSDANATPVVTRYLWCDDEICQQLDDQGNVAAAYFGQGEVHGDTALLYQRDRLGSIRGVVDAQSGQVQGGLSYTAYGQADQVDGTLPDKRYAGMLLHEQSGLYLTKYRAYDSRSGRWLSRDPIGENGGINLYSYVDSDPISNADPLGLTKWRGYPHGGGAGGIFGCQKMNIHLTSECALEEKVVVDINMHFLITGVGSPVSYTISNIELDDPYAGAYPEVLTGISYVAGAGIAVGGGASYQTLTIGEGFSDFSLGGQGGWDASLAGGIGKAFIDGEPKRIKCGCDK